MNLSGTQLGELHEILCNSFDSATLARMLRYKLDVRLDHITGNSDFRTMAHDVLEHFNQKHTIETLIDAARQSRPADGQLFEFASKISGIDQSKRHSLESIIVGSNHFFDLTVWRNKLAQIENQVCRIDFQGNPCGTGFLIGPDLVLTNYHVISSAGECSSWDSSQWTARFDYKIASNGSLSSGIAVKFADGGLVGTSPASPFDTESKKRSEPRTNQYLDYAVLRLAESIGNKCIGVKPEPQAEERGYIRLPVIEPGLEENTGLIIIQHPKGSPLKLAFDTCSIEKYNADHTRISYRTNTEPGSSGSPCFSFDLNLVALHQAGDAAYPELASNQGIPIWAITQDLISKGVQYGH